MEWRLINDTRGQFSQGDVTDKPCPAITVSAVHQYCWLKSMVDKKTVVEDKPPYKIPSMQEISEIEWNGYNVISTFSGCGGSSLGYRLAGYKVLWANEFIPIAADTYELNHKGTIVDRRDIRIIHPEEILEAIGLKQGELDLMDGSPPCQAFSTAGKREKGWGKDKQYDNGIKQKNEILFDEYIRILKIIQPKVFIAENVSGLLKGTAKGYFKLILQALKDCGYNVKARLLDAQWLGVPQQRQRVIFQGVRNDIDIEPCYPKPLGYRYTVRDVFPDLIAFRGIGNGWSNETPDIDNPTPTVLASMQSPWNAYEIESFTEKRKFSISELKQICAFPDDFKLLGTFSQQWERLGNCVPPMMMYYISRAVQEGVLDRQGQKIEYEELTR